MPAGRFSEQGHLGNGVNGADNSLDHNRSMQMRINARQATISLQEGLLQMSKLQEVLKKRRSSSIELARPSAERGA